MSQTDGTDGQTEAILKDQGLVQQGSSRGGGQYFRYGHNIKIMQLLGNGQKFKSNIELKRTNLLDPVFYCCSLLFFVVHCCSLVFIVVLRCSLLIIVAHCYSLLFLPPAPLGQGRYTNHIVSVCVSVWQQLCQFVK